MNRSNSYHIGLLLQRIGFSGMLLFHGIPKLLKVINGDFEFADPIGIGATLTLILAVIGEVVSPLFIILGYKTRLATIPTIITFLVAVFVYHGSDPIDIRELAIVYLIAFMAIGFLGAGKYSIDKK